MTTERRDDASWEYVAVGAFTAMMACCAVAVRLALPFPADAVPSLLAARSVPVPPADAAKAPAAGVGTLRPPSGEWVKFVSGRGHDAAETETWSFDDGGVLRVREMDPDARRAPFGWRWDDDGAGKAELILYGPAARGKETRLPLVREASGPDRLVFLVAAREDVPTLLVLNRVKPGGKEER